MRTSPLFRALLSFRLLTVFAMSLLPENRGGVDKISPLCEEYRQTNFLSKNLTWGNVDGESADGFFHIRTAHISADFVHGEPQS